MVKKTICLIFLLCCMHTTAYGQQVFPFLGEITADNVNVRAGQSVNFERLYQLNKGDSVAVIGHSYSWYKIRLPEQAKVYVNKNFIRHRVADVSIVTGNRVNLRAGPGQKYSVLGQLGKGTLVKVKKTKGYWAQIEPMEGVYGWVADRFIAFHSAHVPPPKVVKEPTRNIYAQTSKQKPATMIIPSKRKVRQAIAEKKKEEGQFSVVGRVEDLGRVVPPKDITYKLVIDEETAYYLQGSRYLIDSFIYYKVRVYGKIKDDPQNVYEYPVIVVSKVKLVL